MVLDFPHPKYQVPVTVFQSNDASLLAFIGLLESRLPTVVGRTLVRTTSMGAWFLVRSLFLALPAITSSGHDGCDVSIELTFHLKQPKLGTQKLKQT